MKEDEIAELNQQALDSAAGAETEKTDEKGTDQERRRFIGNLATVLGSAAVIGSIGALAGESDPAEAKEVKSKILSRIQQQLKQEQGEEGMVYEKSAHDRYSKSGGGPVPVNPIVA